MSSSALLHGIFLLLASLGLCMRLSAAPAALLPDPGLELPPVPAGWEVSVYGAQPEISLDSDIAHGGKHSWRIHTADASDTALGLELVLTPGRQYCFAGWVRTKGLRAPGAGATATLQVQQSRGAGVVASGESHDGDTEWTEVPVYFRAPASGRVRLCLFFVGFGKGTGTVWFDDLRLEEIDLGQQLLKVTREPLVAGKINPMQYGQFIEYLCDLVPSMWAEKLCDGSFEGLSPYKVAFLKETDFKEKPWYPSGQVNRARFELDSGSRVSGNLSKKVEALGDEPCRVGFSQDGLYVEKARACEFKIWLRTSGIAGPIRVSIHREHTVYATCELRPTNEWAEYRALLTPSGTDDRATLSIDFAGPGTLWADNASLMPTDAVGGWRPEVVAAVRALKPGIIRFGGSALDDSNLGEFEWKDTIGDPNRRKPFRAWGGLQPTGPGIEEIVQFCGLVGAEPLICLRFSGKTPRDAADEVEYFNGSPSTPMGALRARNGHAEPYHIRYWQIGNERESKDYEDSLGAYCRAVRQVDPQAKLLSSFPTAQVIRKAGAGLDYVCPHHYTEDLGWMERNLGEVAGLLRENAPGANIKVGVTEWNTTAGDWGPRRAMLLTLGNALACSRYHNLLHRHADLVEIANRSNLANSFCSGIIQMDNHRLYKAPTYYAQWLYSNLAGNQPLKIESSPASNSVLDISATVSASGRELTLFVVNDGPAPQLRQLDLAAFGKSGQRLSVWTLEDRKHLGEPDAANSFGEPDRISPFEKAVRVDGPRFSYRFPALSLTVLRWKIEPTRPL